ncbi:ATP-binding cassette domain-containing protein [Candidatus Bipolaricaulota bacterium]|nr:ATP-binding cassette domain-containing protein [Candidatus Bipolaricaulota bacterium]MBS3792311.1 ATP-binding cassette domain-containing protein [Candidatus Bipolaricaulota bacterium]
MTNLLEVEGLELKINLHWVLKNLDFHVEKEEIVAIVGENGSGKTMTLRSLAGLEESSAKRLVFGDRDLQGMPPHERTREGLSYCPSEMSIFPKMTVKENLEMGKYLYPEETSRGVHVAYQLFPVLEGRNDQQAAKLSGGERHMLALAKSLMVNPELLLLDEFSLGLARKIALEFSDKVREIYRTGVSVLFVEQNLGMAAKLAHRDYYMVEGQIEEKNVLS